MLAEASEVGQRSQHEEVKETCDTEMGLDLFTATGGMTLGKPTRTSGAPGLTAVGAVTTSGPRAQGQSGA